MNDKKSNYRYDHGFFRMVLICINAIMLIHGNIHGFFGQKTSS